MPSSAPAPVLGLILAGGGGRRLGGADKALLELGGRPLLAHVVERFSPQCAALALNALGDAARFSGFGLPVLADDPDFVDAEGAGAGPLSGLLAGLDFAAATGWDRIVTIPVDTPFFPADYVARLIQTDSDMPGAQIVCAQSAGRMAQDGVHYVCGLFPVSLRDALRADIAAGARRVSQWVRDHGMAPARFDIPPGGPDPFLNINTPEDRAEAERILRGA